MLIEIILFLLLGILAGTITGLIPGIHINLVGAILVSYSAAVFSSLGGIYFAVFMVSMSISHVFMDFIPSIFLGAPEDGTELSVLPGHEMLRQGLGFQAVHLAILGCLFGTFAFAFLSVPLYFIVPKIYSVVKTAIPFLLILVSFVLVFSEKKKKSAFFAFLLS